MTNESLALKRMLANGPLTGFPTRRSDQELLLRLAAARFEPERRYSEAEVNETLRTWLATFCAPFGIDHVSLRRYLVDARLLGRDTSGSSYRLLRKSSLAPLDLAQILAGIQRERAERKRQHAP